MTSRRDERQGHADRTDDAAAARTDWLTEQLGEQWRSDGDGVYRFVGSSPPLEPESDEDLDDVHAPLTRDSSDSDHSTSEEPQRHWRVPWRRH
jgi:hypothetical protein